MVNLKNTIQIGITRKPFGVAGQIKISVATQYLEDLMAAEMVLLEMSGQQVPYFVENIRLTADVIAKFEEVDSKEAAAKIVSKPIYLRESDLLPPDQKAMTAKPDDPSQRYLDFILEDVHLGRIGPIIRIEEYPQQDMAFVAYKDTEVMIPLHDRFILEADADGKRLVVELPAGILEL